jgi:two-component system, OmpR family, sensor histidine kinase VicK
VSKIDESSSNHDNDNQGNNEIEYFHISDKDKDKFNNTIYSWYNNENNIAEEKTIVVYGEEKTSKIILKALYNSKERWDNYANSEGPAVAIGLEPLKEGMNNACNRGVKIRYISEITKNNINYCKELMEIAELRHLDEIKGGMAINETEYIATAHLQEAKPVAHLIYSNVIEIVEQQQLVFESFWNKSIPADQKIKEIEEGIEPIKTKVLENQNEIYNHLKNILKKSNERFVCCCIGGLQMVCNNFFNLYEDIIERQKKGEGDGIKWLTFIDDNKNNIELVKKFLNAGIQIRHLKNLPSMNFSFDSKSIEATMERMDYGSLMNNLLISNEPAYIKHFTSYFQELWDNHGIDAEERIKDIEEGMEYDIEVIRHSDRSLKIYLNIVKSAKNEIFFIFPTPRAFIRQLKAIDLANQAANERNVKVKILTPCNEIVEKSIKHFLKKGQNKEEKQNQGISKNSIDSFPNDDIEVRYIEKMANTKATILVADRKESLVMELKDDVKDNFIESIGLSIHSTSKANVLSYVAIFENLWKQSELYQEIKESNKKLESKDKVLNEFIHIAAHELRNPIQPILSLSQIVKSELSNKIDLETDKDKIFKMLDVIIRNAKKLYRLSNDILDLAKIETNSFTLYKETFNLKYLLQELIGDIKSQQQKNDICDIELYFFDIKEQQQEEQNENYFIIEADQARISQVVSNLLLNAIKFTIKDCLIQVILEKKEIDFRKKEVIVSIKDKGTGIDPEIFPRLFTKFATKSSKGTGLGLYICKNIIEAHGGKIWAENNHEDGKGATFSFSLPLADNYIK